MVKKISVLAPSTIANVGCAFDVLGLALDSAGDTVSVKEVDQAGLTLRVSGSTSLPSDPEKNVVIVSARALIAGLKKSKPDLQFPAGLHFELTKGLPIGSGLGSSSASSAATVVALNEFLGRPFSARELVEYAMEGERSACGSAHADNVAPAILGGVVLIRSYAPLDIISLPYPKNLLCVVTIPGIEVKTSDARKILRKEIAFSKAVQQWGNIAGLVAGFCSEDADLIGRSLQDYIVEPERAYLIPGFHQVKQAALEAGALGCSISGAGPTTFAFAKEYSTAQVISRKMQEGFRSAGISSQSFISKINPAGAKVIP